MPNVVGATLALLSVLGLLGAAPAEAESSLRLPAPETFGEIAAGTYDESGRRVGDAVIRMERSPSGLVELEARSGIADAEHTIVTARLAPVDGDAALRPLFQSSRSFDATGQPLGVMRIDHERGEVVCVPPNADEARAERMSLPATERVANVPLNLLFVPLVTGEKQRIEFQFVLCRGGVRLIDASARVVGRKSSGGEELVEVRYNFDLGPLLSRLAQPFLPRLSVWFNPTAAESWVGHRMPLFSKGPTVVVMRSGWNPTLLGLGR